MWPTADLATPFHSYTYCTIFIYPIAFSTSYVNFKNSTEKLYIYITYGQENEILTTMTKYYELWLVKFHGTDELSKI